MDTQAFKERVKTQFLSREMQSVDVPQWGIKIYFRSPSLSTLKTVTAEANGDGFEFNARIVAACALDESGAHIWKKVEYRDMMTDYDPAVIVMIANAIMEDMKLGRTPQEQAEDEKN